MTEPVKRTRARDLLGANVAELRQELKVSQERLAEMAGFHRTYVSQVERCVVNVTTDNLEKLADVLGVPVARLFKLTKEIE